jgi:hypothetical protein
MMLPKRKRWISKVYRDWVSGFPCAACGNSPPSDCHHFSEQGSGMGMKPDDAATLPLCRPCHDHWHSRAYLPIFEYKSTWKGAAADEATQFELARVRSMKLFYQAQASLLAKWIKDYSIDIPQGASDDGESEAF